MNTNTIIGIVVAIVVVAGGAWYFMAGQDAGSPAGQESENADTTGGSPTGGAQGASQPGRGTGTFAELLGGTGNYRCTFDSSVENSQTSGTIYVGDNRMRGDFATIADGTRIESHMAREGGYVYTWTNLTTQGFKMKETAGTGASSGGSAQGIDASANVTYDCSPWIVDTRLLGVPSNITFMTAPGQ